MSANIFWAYRELTNRLEEQAGEPLRRFQAGEAHEVPEWGTVFLFDPEMRERLDEEIRSRYFPAVLEGLRGSPVRVDDGANVFSHISDKRDRIATRQLSFLLEEPPRPSAGPDAPLWYIRGAIECSLEICMARFDLALSLPLSVDLDSMLELMKDDRMGGIPPTLSFERRISGKREYLLSFSRGSGTPYDMQALITESIRKHLRIIEAVNRLERQWSSPELFSDLSAKIIAMYGD